MLDDSADERSIGKPMARLIRQMNNEIDIITSDERRQAYHEAGHAVMAFFGGQKIKSIRIAEARFHGSSIAVGTTKYHLATYSRLIDYPNDTARALAGAQAERLYSGGIYLRGIGGDLESAARIHAEFAAEAERHGARDISSLEDAWNHTGRTLTSNWWMVEAIAQRLLKKRWLPGRSVTKIIHDCVRKRGG